MKTIVESAVVLTFLAGFGLVRLGPSPAPAEPAPAIPGNPEPIPFEVSRLPAFPCQAEPIEPVPGVNKVRDVAESPSLHPGAGFESSLTKSPALGKLTLVSFPCANGASGPLVVAAGPVRFARRAFANRPRLFPRFRR